MGKGDWGTGNTPIVRDECAAFLQEEIASLLVHPLFLNPLTPKSDQILISPYNYITLESNVKVTGIKEMITYISSSWFLNKFSLSVLQEMYREQYGEYSYWC